MRDYSIYSDFNIEDHKKHFLNYLEVMISPEGEIKYAIPSHQIFAEKVAMEKLGITKATLSYMCPKEYYGDYLRWLLSLTDYIAVWNEFYEQGVNCKLTKLQKAKLTELKMNGLYRGPIYKAREDYIDQIECGICAFQYNSGACKPEFSGQICLNFKKKEIIK